MAGAADAAGLNGSHDPSDVVADARRRTMILVAMCTALVAVIASVSGLNVAQQQLTSSLGATQSQLLWVINGLLFYVLIFSTGQWLRLVPVTWEVFPAALATAIGLTVGRKRIERDATLASRQSV